MRKLSIALPKRVYGLVLGSFCLGIQLTKLGKRPSFSLVATKIMREPYKLYGLFLGKRFFGWGNLPKYTRTDIKNALVDIALSKNPPSTFAMSKPVDHVSVVHVLKYDMNQPIPSASLQEAEDYLDGKVVLDNPPQHLYDVLNTKHAETSSAASSESTNKSRQNYYKRNVANHVVRTKEPLYNAQPEKDEDLAKEAFPPGEPE